MIEIEDKIVSLELFEQRFSCDLEKCRGVCCVEGDAGAPLAAEEVDLLEKNLEIIKTHMCRKGIVAVEKQGVFVIDEDGDRTTPLIDGGPCAYVVSQDGCTRCAIEKAYLAGEIRFRKPVSCHLYPIRTTRLGNGSTALNYHRWHICRDAVRKGEREGTAVYKSLRTPIERVFGADFYRMLEEADGLLKKEAAAGEGTVVE